MANDYLIVPRPPEAQHWLNGAIYAPIKLGNTFLIPVYGSKAPAEPMRQQVMEWTYDAPTSTRVPIPLETTGRGVLFAGANGTYMLSAHRFAGKQVDDLVWQKVDDRVPVVGVDAAQIVEAVLGVLGLVLHPATVENLRGRLK
jgi:hypothetical protein